MGGRDFARFGEEFELELRFEESAAEVDGESTEGGCARKLEGANDLGANIHSCIHSVCAHLSRSTLWLSTSTLSDI